MKLKQAIVKNGQSVEIDGSSTETLMDRGLHGGAKNLRVDWGKRVVFFEDKAGHHFVPFENLRRGTALDEEQPAAKAKAAAVAG